MKYVVAMSVPFRYDAMVNRAKGMSGALPDAAYRRSHQTNAVANTTNTTSDHQRRGSSSGEPVVNRNGHMSVTIMTPNSTSPIGSSCSRPGALVRVRGSRKITPASTARHSGTFIQKIQRQPSCAPPRAIMRPPRVGPNAVAMPIVAPNRPNARPRSLPVKICWIVPITCGIWMPAASPCTSRPMISTSIVGASAHTIEVIVNRLRPTMNRVFRERWSPSRPNGTSASPNISTYPDTTICSWVDAAPNAASIDGSATLTLLRSRIVRAATETHTQNARQRWPWSSGMLEVAGEVIGPRLCPHTSGRGRLDEKQTTRAG